MKPFNSVQKKLAQARLKMLSTLSNPTKPNYIYLICFVLSELISVARQYLPVAGIETPVDSNVNTSF